MSSSAWTNELSFTISFARLSEVRPHEEVIEKNLNELAKSIKKDGVQIDPVVVDSKTGVALDGMHRIAALKALEVKRIMVAKVDYADERIKVYRWLRAVKNYSLNMIDELKVALNLRKAGSQLEAMQLVDQEKFPLALLFDDMAYVSAMEARGFERFPLIKEFDRRVKEYVGILDRDLLNYLKNGYMVLYVKKPEKSEVIEAGMKGMLFPPKSTRHVIPYRPVNVRCPLELLSGRMSDSEAEEALNRLLGSMSKKLLPPNSLYAGRVYEEELILYNP
ncbi:MAG: ParB N-terminal domain-containing protein [Nitrososphaeria archaeon]